MRARERGRQNEIMDLGHNILYNMIIQHDYIQSYLLLVFYVHNTSGSSII